MTWRKVDSKTLSVTIKEQVKPTTNTTMMLLGAGVLLAMALSKK